MTWLRARWNHKALRFGCGIYWWYCYHVGTVSAWWVTLLILLRLLLVDWFAWLGCSLILRLRASANPIIYFRIFWWPGGLTTTQLVYISYLILKVPKIAMFQTRNLIEHLLVLIPQNVQIRVGPVLTSVAPIHNLLLWTMNRRNILKGSLLMHRRHWVVIWLK